jgi:hypothetical protein
MAATRTARLGAFVAGVTLLLGVVGCDSSSDGTSAPRPTTTTTSPGNPDLEKLLMQDGEEPGFVRGALPGARPSALQTLTGVDAFVAELHLTAADKTRLEGEGFLAFSAGPIRGGTESAGVTNVALYETAAGAQHSQANDLRPEVVTAGGPLQGLTFFDVPGVPGARGWKATEPPVGNITWVDGRCYYVLGNQGPGDLQSRLTSGVIAIYSRTKGQCP